MTSDLSDATSAQMFVEQQLHEAATDIGDGSRNKKVCKLPSIDVDLTTNKLIIIGL